MMVKLEKECSMLLCKFHKDIEGAKKENIIKARHNGNLVETRKKLKDIEARRMQ
jgi:hypothetical protein